MENKGKQLTSRLNSLGLDRNILILKSKKRFGISKVRFNNIYYGKTPDTIGLMEFLERITKHLENTI